MRVLYLHGFASGPSSRKARFFGDKLRALGFKVDVPDLSEGNFRELTISAQLAVMERIGKGEPLILIGSSMGGYLAALYAEKHPEVARLVLLAPAFCFYQLWMTQIPAMELTRWRENGSIDVFHYGAGRKMPLEYRLLEDAKGYAAFPRFSQPALIFHGEQDSSVPIQYSVEFVQNHSNARLVRLESGHELTDVLEPIWHESEEFIVQPSN